MKKIITTLLLIISPLYGTTALEEALHKDIEDGSLDSFSLIEAAFIISGENTEDNLNNSINWYQKLLDDIESKRIIDIFEKKESAEKLFLYLHTTWLKKYEKKATTLTDIKDTKTYNCVSATILYNLICEDVGIPTMAFETPTHVYTIFEDFGRDVMVENTTSMGFNIIKNLQNYSRYMSQYYPEQQIYQIGLHRLYAYENSKGRKITNMELLGLISYNQAYFAYQDKSFQKSYEYVLLAQSFNQDSRSNIDFENKLYYTWGSQQYQLNNYYQSFEIFADAYYRYPENKDFKQNCIVTFIKSLQELWSNKDWETTKVTIYDMDELNILSNKEFAFLKDMLINWGKYFHDLSQKDNGLSVVDTYKQIIGTDDQILRLEQQIRTLQ